MEAYFLHSTNDTRDRSSEIEQLLAKYKVCILGSGAFYVSGVMMPEDSSIMGMGACSELILSEEVQSGYAIQMTSRCSVRNLAVKGAAEDIERPTELGDRHGIAFMGEATPQDRGDPPVDSMISGCQIRSFTGGGITCKSTGYGINCSLCVSDCRIHQCGAGINISYFSEFHKFTNVVSTRNLYGCINNGGNNVFVGCAFDGNTLGFLIDNSRKQSPNTAHGSCVACTFNHSNYNEGVGIRVLGAKPGFVFSDCQLFYSDIEVENSKGIQFNHFNLGAVKVRICGESTVTIHGCIFTKPPEEFTVDSEAKVKVWDCYTRLDGEPVVL